jgi:hypothetical protein
LLKRFSRGEQNDDPRPAALEHDPQLPHERPPHGKRYRPPPEVGGQADDRAPSKILSTSQFGETQTVLHIRRAGLANLQRRPASEEVATNQVAIGRELRCREGRRVSPLPRRPRCPRCCQ